MIWRLVAPILLLDLLAAPFATADDLPSAIRQLQAVRSVVEAGVTFAEYQRRVLDAKIVIDRYLSAPARAADTKRLAAGLSIGLYVRAGDAWNYAITLRGARPGAGSGCPPAGDYLAKSLGALELVARENQRRALRGLTITVRDTESELREIFNTSMQIQWRCADDYLADLEGRPRGSWSAPPPMMFDRFGRQISPEQDALERKQREQRAAEEAERDKRRMEDLKARPVCRWEWNGTAWVAVCE